MRLRLKRTEVERLCDSGLVEESIDFGPGAVLTYRLESRLEPGSLLAAFREGAMTVTIPTEVAQTWAGSEEVGIYAQSGLLSISIEKDFRCLTRALDEQERDTYPNPGQPAETL